MRFFDPSLIGLVQNEPAKVYSNRDDSQQPMAILPVGTEVQVDESTEYGGKEYTKVRTAGGHRGYITGDVMLNLVVPAFVHEDVDVHAEPSASSPVKAHYKRLSLLWIWRTDQGWTKVRDEHGNEGYVQGQVKTNGLAGVLKLVAEYRMPLWVSDVGGLVKKEPLKVYANTNDSRTPLAVLNIGAEVRVVGSFEHAGKGFAQVRLASGQVGYIDANAVLSPILPHILLDDADMHSEPNASSPIKARYGKGSILYLLPVEHKEWSNVRDLHGNEGYIPDTVHFRATLAELAEAAIRSAPAGRS